MILEWDWSCLERKFSKCVAHCTINDETRWRWIQAIGEDGYVYAANGNIIGSWKTQMDGQRAEDDFPLVEFHYTPVPVGWCHTNQGVARILRNHMGKIYKVGIDFDGYSLFAIRENGLIDESARFYTRQFMPEMQVFNRTLGDFHIFSPFLWKKRESLMFYDEEIGFVEKFRCVLKSALFKPLVLPYMGDQWQIENYA